jgi:hypothetical protein
VRASAFAGLNGSECWGNVGRRRRPHICVISREYARAGGAK